MNVRTADPRATATRPTWRTVAIPSEHGGWGLTGEPIALGLVLVFSWAGVAIATAAMLAFLARTPLKLAMVDRRRGRELERSALARRIGVAELFAIAALGTTALLVAGWHWLVPVAVALPLFGVELWFDVRSRGRRLVPELCGAIGMGAVAAAIVVAGDGSIRLAVAAWMILAARSIGAIAFIRTQIARLHRGEVSTRSSDMFQLLATADRRGRRSRRSRRGARIARRSGHRRPASRVGAAVAGAACEGARNAADGAGLRPGRRHGDRSRVGMNDEIGIEMTLGAIVTSHPSLGSRTRTSQARLLLWGSAHPRPGLSRGRTRRTARGRRAGLVDPRRGLGVVGPSRGRRPGRAPRRRRITATCGMNSHASRRCSTPSSRCMATATPNSTRSPRTSGRFVPISNRTS